MSPANPVFNHWTSAQRREPFRFGTKAETLARLRPLLRGARILDLDWFSVRDWRQDNAALLTRIAERFGQCELVVRSSAHGEDGAERSMAGAYHSCLRVDGVDRIAVKRAVEEVIGSYSGNPEDQVLIQPMVGGVAVSGVIMTHDLEHGSPYYVINYDDESGRTDSITSGDGVYKTVLVYRDCDPGHLRSERVSRFLALAREVESLCGSVPLDIEFGLARDGQMYLFQVRRISLCRSWHPVTERRVSRQIGFVDRFIQERSLPRPGLLGRRTILGVMPDWNPAEILGANPRPLAVSLYRELVTREVWRTSRTAMGYRELPPEELMVVIGGHPYIDVRNSFNSFLPAGLEEEIGGALVDGWLERLHANPELHDKVEFAVAQTCLDFTFEEDFRTRYGELLDEAGLGSFRERLRALTGACLRLDAGGSLGSALAAVKQLTQRQNARGPVSTGGGTLALHAAAELLEECRALGTFPFAVLARHAFMAEALLRSAVRRGALSVGRLRHLKRSVHTVTSDLAGEYARVCRGERSVGDFLGAYGHLRPGTYDITSLRYDERGDLFSTEGSFAPQAQPEQFSLGGGERKALQDLLAEAGLDSVDTAGLLEYARRAIAGREWGKFVFTRSLSDALGAIACWGESEGLSRDDLSFLTWPELASYLVDPVLDHADREFLDQTERARRAYTAGQALRLGYLLRDVRDMYVVPVHRSAPNFIGAGRVEGPVVMLDSRSSATTDLFDRVVCIENADPGYDWIFTKGVRGLITKFGGANSHMAIRCAEFGLPAAIGCGEQTFGRLMSCGTVLLDCDNKQLRPLCHD